LGRRSASVFDAAAEAQVDNGFGPTKDGEDPFDALVGLCSMIDVAVGRRAAGEPDVAFAPSRGGYSGKAPVVDVARSGLATAIAIME
jgi:hypothetical protein